MKYKTFNPKYEFKWICLNKIYKVEKREDKKEI